MNIKTNNLFILLITMIFIYLKSSAQQSNTSLISNKSTVPAIATHSVEAEPAFACVKYEFKHIYDTLQANSPDVKLMSLFIAKNNSKYVDDRIYNSVVPIATVVSNSEYSEASERINSLNNQSLGVYKNYRNSKISIVDLVVDNISLVEEEIPTIPWKITTETKEIKGLKCQKAIGDCKGRTYEAWFCKDYPYSAGPWKLSGLPGLIIEASDTKNQVVFSFVGYEKLSTNTTDISIPIEIKKIELSAYKKVLDSYIVYKIGDKKFKVMDDGTGNPLSQNIFSNNGSQLEKITINNPIELK
jgi:GLPGLI family protein